MGPDEMHRTRDLEGFAEAVTHQAKDWTRLENMEGRPGYWTVGFASRATGATMVWGVMLLAQVGGMMLKALLLLFYKLDSIERLLAKLFEEKQ